MNYPKALWLTLVIFIIHNVEEYLTMSGFFAHNLHAIPRFAARFVHPIPNNVFLTMLIVVTLIALLLVYVGSNERLGERGFFWGLVLVTSGLLANGLNHLGMALIMGIYVPGLISAVTLALPYSIYLCNRLVKEQRTDIPSLIKSLITGIALLLPTILITRAVATWIFI